MSDLIEQTTPVIAMDSVTSSQIHSIGHSPETSTLAVRFRSKDGAPTSLYHYSNVDAETFAAFKGAESIGSHFYKHIKPNKERFPFVCIEKMPQPEQEQA